MYNVHCTTDDDDYIMIITNRSNKAECLINVIINYSVREWCCYQWSAVATTGQCSRIQFHPLAARVVITRGVRLHEWSESRLVDSVDHGMGQLDIKRNSLQTIPYYSYDHCL